MTFIVLTARLGFPLKVFRTMQEAMPWLLATTGPALTENIRHDQLSILIDDLRKAQFSRPP